MMVKVGDKVQIDELFSSYYGECGIVSDSQRFGAYPYKVRFEDGGWSIFTEKDLIVLSTEEETSVKFKVGDKVKVSNSWEGNSGKIGTVVKVTSGEPYAYRINFEDASPESFKEEELELVKEKVEKQSFTKSDLKTGMGVVLRDGDKGHILLDTEAGDVIRFIDGDNHEWMSTKDYDSEMCDSDMDRLDIMEVYSSHLAYCYVTERLFDSKNRVFKREEPTPEPTKMTMKEINEHFGKAIEIIE